MVLGYVKMASQLDEISQELIELDVFLSKIEEFGKDFKGGVIKIEKDILKRREDYKEFSEELENIRKKIDGIDDEKLQHLERNYRGARSAKESIISEIGSKRQSIKSHESEVDALGREYENQIKKIEKHESKKNKILFSRECISVARQVMEEVREEIRKKIEDATKSQFFATIWKKATYKDVKIDADYNISVSDQKGTESIGTLSAGESQFLALSFVTALHLVSGFRTPIMIDTPLGRISGEPKINLAKGLHKFTGGKQIVLLVTDQEYTEEVRNVMKKDIGKEYCIDFKEKNDGCEAEVIDYAAKK